MLNIIKNVTPEFYSNKNFDIQHKKDFGHFVCM